jgi:uncharacterized protein YoxC
LNDIERIVSDLEQQREAIDRVISALREITQSASTVNEAPAVEATTRPRKRHRLSAAGRWALERGTKSAVASKK